MKILKQHSRRPGEPSYQVEPMEQGGQLGEIALGHSPPETAFAEPAPEEVLVADPRGALTPAQMVDRKLLALLGRGYPGHVSRNVSSRGNIRRASGSETHPG